ncbi:chitobiase/beta-hexosaminidase C-terminal domain-containing protein [Bacillus luti]|uniref:chitobiase/beta-hexosaminidase C-terminal domain-containing protein n=1 Tax=Bacillus luti TaxID=2026191 RepID=UPI00289ADA09|nr:chitobiase/beta-hexosaminidase C-terminal domain-containing protein [Bacillus luti]
MAEFKKSLPIWNATGVEPPLSKAERGWKVDERPPADYMNYLQNRTYEAIKELQENAVHKETIVGIQTDINTAKQGVSENANQIKGLQEQIATGGSGVLSFHTLSELQRAFPNGSDKPVWIVSENSWYYWEGSLPPGDTTPPIITINPAGGTFGSVQTVTLTTNEAATIYYTLDGSTPTTSSTVYNSPIVINTNTTLRCVAKDLAGNLSAVKTETYTINAADTTPPNNVTNLQVINITKNSLSLSWSASTSSDVSNYQVFNGSTYLGQTAGTSYNVTGLTANTNYTFIVKARDTSGNLASGTSVSTKTAEDNTTQPPLDLVEGYSLLLKDINRQTNVENPNNYFLTNQDFTFAMTLIIPTQSGVLSKWVFGEDSTNVMQFLTTINSEFTVTLIGKNGVGNNSSANVKTSPVNDMQNIYYHVTVTKRGSELLIYLNGVQDNVSTIPSGFVLNAAPDTKNLTLGQNGKTFVIKNFIYYHKALTNEEVKKNYNSLKF